MANFTVTISDLDIKALEDDLLDIDEWIQGAVSGKINNCKKRMVRNWQQKLFNDPNVDSIPATADAMIEYVIGRDDYKNRITREAEITEELI